MNNIEALIGMLPYVRKAQGATWVIKYGGSAMTDHHLKESFAQDVTLLKMMGLHPVVVHGGGLEISKVMKRLGKEPVFTDGLRVTDSETLEIAEMVLAGKVNTELVSLINGSGSKAVGLTGKDAGLILARKHRAAKDLGYVGDVERVDSDLVRLLCDQGYIPVICSIGQGEDGTTYNINADSVAGALAGALKAQKLILLTDVKGVYREPDDPASLVHCLSEVESRMLIAEGKISRGMMPKVKACMDALSGGALETKIADGRNPHAILSNLAGHDGGTAVFLSGGGKNH